jgi:hypothetical protein
VPHPHKHVHVVAPPTKAEETEHTRTGKELTPNHYLETSNATPKSRWSLAPDRDATPLATRAERTPPRQLYLQESPSTQPEELNVAEESPPNTPEWWQTSTPTEPASVFPEELHVAESTHDATSDASPLVEPTEATCILDELSNVAESTHDAASETASLANAMLVFLFSNGSLLQHEHYVQQRLQSVLDMRKKIVTQLARDGRGAQPPTQYTQQEWEDWIGAREFDREQMAKALEIWTKEFEQIKISQQTLCRIKAPLDEEAKKSNTQCAQCCTVPFAHISKRNTAIHPSPKHS